VLKINGKLSGASQDELVLMQMIEENYDSIFVSRDADSITIEVNNVKEVYDIIKFYEFTSERKMMSITVKRQSDGALLNFAKGADMMIKKKLEEQGKAGVTLFE
jgi:magnesium-transporting ATPase (P-type)